MNVRLFLRCLIAAVLFVAMVIGIGVGFPKTQSVGDFLLLDWLLFAITRRHAMLDPIYMFFCLLFTIGCYTLLFMGATEAVRRMRKRETTTK